ncbi:heavy-metal-associated domain-containing protein [Parasulfuritortus cantonensis]|uniref:Heavy-metal-associated domain-containing protein n=2 Tax=Parasulfuritortus cantonensis TaxID=2528202 RepID=A0A4R1BEJ0_9PROT|nr:heavy-metal-associated domain-containing protein [Parasulfuritortus cantonensis]
MHHVPGRLRLKGCHFRRDSATAARAVAGLRALAGVELVKLNHHAGSLTVHYDPARQSQAELLAVLERYGCLNAVAAPAGAGVRPAATDGLAGTFGKALMGVLAQRTATRLIGVLL